MDYPDPVSGCHHNISLFNSRMFDALLCRWLAGAYVSVVARRDVLNPVMVLEDETYQFLLCVHQSVILHPQSITNYPSGMICRALPTLRLRLASCH